MTWWQFFSNDDNFPYKCMCRISPVRSFHLKNLNDFSTWQEKENLQEFNFLSDFHKNFADNLLLLWQIALIQMKIWILKV